MLNWQEESKVYIAKLGSQISSVTQILKMNSQGLIKEELREKLSDFKEKAETIKDKLEKNEYEIAIVGLEKAGKSSFANALIRSNILPSKDARCTYTSTCIRYGEESKAVIKFFTRNEFNRDFKKNLKEMGIQGYENISFDSISIEAYRRMFEELDKGSQLAYGNTINRDIENILQNQDTLARYLNGEDIHIEQSTLGEEGFKKAINDYIERPDQAIAVKEINIFSNELAEMKNVIIYDVPGFDSPTKMHMEQTVDKMKKADAIILIANAGKPSFTAPQLEVFRQAYDEDGISLSKKLFVFGNKADTANSALEDNIQELRKEVYERYKILDIQDKNRFHYGSARANLEAIHKEENTGINERLKRFNITDGIDEIKNALIAYNQSERFEVLKTRINKMENEIISLFDTLINKYSSDGNLRESFDKNSKLTIEVFNKGKKEIKRRLEEYRDRIKTRYNSLDGEDRPLTAKVKAQIRENINVEKLGVTEEEKEIAINSLRGISPVFDGLNVSQKIREKKFDQIYDVFSNEIVGLAMDEHKNSNEDMEEIFIQALQVTSNNMHYTTLKENIAAYISQNGEACYDKGYYESLVERFSRDLIEILIQYTYSDMARWNKFEVEKDNFYSLGMFYKGKRVDLPASKQPFNYMLLTHGYDNVVEQVRSAEEFIEGLVGTATLGVEIYKLIKEFTYLDLVNSGMRLKKLFENYDKESQAIGIIKDTLEYGIRKYQEGDIGPSIYEELNQSTYEAFFKGRGTLDYDVIVEEINEDINILEQLLIDAVVAAINIEKPFLAKEIKSIDRIIASLDDEEAFGEFIIQNIGYIRAETINEYEREVQQRHLFACITEEINTILGDMKQCV